MKSNAIMRIVVWSIVILVLVGILCSVMFGVRVSRNSFARREVSETVVTADLETPVTQLNSEETLRLDPDDVRDIEIEWVSGSIVIQPADVEKIEISESDVSDAKYAMVWKHKGNKLSISFSEDNTFDFPSFGFDAEFSKDLTIYVPRDWNCGSLEIDAASAAVEVNDLNIGEVEFDGASGECEFENCTVEKFDLDTASGDVTFVGSLNILECDAASANIYAVLENIPTRMDMDTMSGDLEITLPENAGFTVSMDGMSTSFSSDFETTMKNGNYVCGDGSCRINVDGMSGDVTIYKGETLLIPAETVVVHHHTEECTTNPESCPDHAATAATEHHEEPTNH